MPTYIAQRGSTLLRNARDWTPSIAASVAYISLLNAVYLLWMAALKLMPGERADLLKLWHGSPLWQALAPVSWGEMAVSGAAMGVELVAGLCLLAYKRRLPLRVGALLAGLIYGFNAIYLFTNPVWGAPLGGFPIIGAGQGLIKYVPMLATALYLAGHAWPRTRWLRNAAPAVALAGVVMVMGWIGAMKFYPFEASGIEPLLRHHWLFSWMYGYWSVQGVSNLIGCTELGFAAVVVVAARWRGLAPLATACIAVIVICTTSFMFTLPGWRPADQFPMLNGAGVFLLKDQFLLAATLLVFHFRPAQRT